jgi:UTP--glucose-1-phosphate uridylyltransferase
MTVRTAVIPAAGLGTRFLPATKVVPKGLLPVVDTPALHLVVAEALAAGIDDVIVVLGPGQEVVRDYFAPAPALESELAARGKDAALAAVRSASIDAVRFVLQAEPLGLGHAVSVTEPLVGQQPFAVLLGDDLLDPAVPLLRDMIAASGRTGGSIVAAMRVGHREIAMYGAIEPGGEDDGLIRVSSLVEKPAPEDAPSDLAVIGRYVFTPGVFRALQRIAPGAGGELQLTDAIALLAIEEPVHAFPFSAGRFDVGNPLDALDAQVALALARNDIGPALRERLVRRLEAGAARHPG